MNADVLDRSQLEALRASLGDEVLLNYLRDFMSLVPQRLLDLHAATREGDRSNWLKLLHNTKGTSGIVGASLISETCLQAYATARAGAFVDEGRVMADLETAWVRTRDELSLYQADLSRKRLQSD